MAGRTPSSMMPLWQEPGKGQSGSCGECEAMKRPAEGSRGRGPESQLDSLQLNPIEPAGTLACHAMPFPCHGCAAAAANGCPTLRWGAFHRPAVELHQQQRRCPSGRIDPPPADVIVAIAVIASICASDEFCPSRPDNHVAPRGNRVVNDAGEAECAAHEERHFPPSRLLLIFPGPEYRWGS